MSNRFFQRRSIWWPTLSGWLLLTVIAVMPMVFWGIQGEAFLATTDRRPAEVLVVEGWIGHEGILAAKAEFDRGGYQFVVTSGSESASDWDGRRWNYANGAGDLLVEMGVPPERVIKAPAEDSKSQRTFSMAVAVRDALIGHGVRPANLNVFTKAAHARRSRLVYAKVLPSGTNVGVIAWSPREDLAGPWWKSSSRALTLLKESVGYIFELVLNSGRTSNSKVVASRRSE